MSQARRVSERSDEGGEVVVVIPDVVKSSLGASAPTVLAALSKDPPFDEMAASVASPALRGRLPGAVAGATLTPRQVVEVVQGNASDPTFVPQLQQAEGDLKRFETEAGLRFADTALKDRRRAGDFQESAEISKSVFKAGMVIVWIAMGGMAVLVVGCLFLTFRGDKVEVGQAAVASFGLIGTAVGFINGIAASIVSFYWGSSQGSSDKSQAIVSSFREFGSQLASAQSRPAAPVVAASARAEYAPVRMDPASPFQADQLAKVVADLATSHRHFPDGAAWALEAGGVAIDGAPAQGTPGIPTTVGQIWSVYGDLCAASAKRHGVPVELIVATIATESYGNPNARRAGGADEKVGLMMISVETARLALGDRDLTGDRLLDARTAINAGTAAIAQQRGQTGFDPPLVAAAYNAGSLRKDDAPGNRWKLACDPPGTGRHIDNWVAFFGDCMRLSAKDGWDAPDNVPGFAAQFKAKGPPAGRNPPPGGAPKKTAEPDGGKPAGG